MSKQREARPDKVVTDLRYIPDLGYPKVGERIEVVGLGIVEITNVSERGVDGSFTFGFTWIEG